MKHYLLLSQSPCARINHLTVENAFLHSAPLTSYLLPTGSLPSFSSWNNQHRCLGVFVSSIKSGSFSLLISMTWAHRVANLHPCGMLSGPGTCPGTESSRDCCLPILGTESIKPFVYGCLGDSNNSFTVASSTTVPAYITTTRSQISDTTLRS